MKQSKSIINPAVGTITETMIICVSLICRTATELSAVVVESSAVAVAKAGDELVPTSGYNSVGTTGDGGKAAVHPWYPIMVLRDQYARSRKMLYASVIAEVSFVIRLDPEEDRSHILTGTMYSSPKGTGEPVCLTQFPFTDDVEVTE